MGFFKNILKSLTKISRPIFSFYADTTQLSFKLLDDKNYLYDLKSYEMKTRHDSYVLEAYTLKTNDIYLEFIDLDIVCSWNGQARSLYENLLKTKLNINLEVSERVEYKHYEFTTYQIDNDFILHLIYIWEGNKNIFILDSKGELYKNLSSSLNKNYTYSFDKFDKLSISFDISIVKENSIKQYFNTSGD